MPLLIQWTPPLWNKCVDYALPIVNRTVSKNSMLPLFSELPHPEALTMLEFKVHQMPLPIHSFQESSSNLSLAGNGYLKSVLQGTAVGSWWYSLTCVVHHIIMVTWWACWQWRMLNMPVGHLMKCELGYSQACKLCGHRSWEIWRGCELWVGEIKFAIICANLTPYP